MDIFTLGPAGTNCEKAAHLYRERQGLTGNIHLANTLETAVDTLLQSPDDGILLGCIVYPELHHIVFRNLGRLKLIDHLLMDTHDMVFASRKSSLSEIEGIGSHPAPISLLDHLGTLRTRVPVAWMASNAEAARQCSEGRVDGCITTDKAARAYGLNVLRNFGAVPMGFSIHLKTPLPRQ
ncbi:prephenate dehydratase domain-containing protein [Burkholderia pyrrocinia]